MERNLSLPIEIQLHKLNLTQIKYLQFQFLKRKKAKQLLIQEKLLNLISFRKNSLSIKMFNNLAKSVCSIITKMKILVMICLKIIKSPLTLTMIISRVKIISKDKNNKLEEKKKEWKLKKNKKKNKNKKKKNLRLKVANQFP